MLARRKEVSAPQHVQIGLRVIPAHLADDVLDANHGSFQFSVFSFQKLARG